MTCDHCTSSEMIRKQSVKYRTCPITFYMLALYYPQIHGLNILKIFNKIKQNIFYLHFIKPPNFFQYLYFVPLLNMVQFDIDHSMLLIVIQSHPEIDMAATSVEPAPTTPTTPLGTTPPLLDCELVLYTVK